MAHLYSTAIKIKIGNIEVFLFVKFRLYGTSFIIWHFLYNPASSSDIGTLFQARNFLNSRSVPKEPMKDVNACEELLLKYSEALIISCYQTMVNETGEDFKDTG